MNKPRAGSGVVINSVSCSIEWEEKRRRLGISASSAYKRGLKFLFDQAKGIPPRDELLRRINKLQETIDEKNVQIELLAKEKDFIKRVKGVQ